MKVTRNKDGIGQYDESDMKYGRNLWGKKNRVKLTETSTDVSSKVLRNWRTA